MPDDDLTITNTEPEKQLNEEILRRNMREISETTMAQIHNLEILNSLSKDTSDGKCATPATWEERKKSCMQYTVPLLAQFEGIRTKAYDDGFGNWTVGIGSTICPDGSPVTRNTTIKSREELEKYTLTHIEEKIYPAMEQYLPVEQLTEQEIAAITSFCYNCGEGVLGRNGKPSAFSQQFTKWKETGDRKYLDAAMSIMKQKDKANGKTLNSLTNRRDFEARILTGDIKLGHAPCTAPNEIDLEQIALGSINTVGYRKRLPRDNAKLVQDTTRVAGPNYAQRLEQVAPKNLNTQRTPPKRGRGR